MNNCSPAELIKYKDIKSDHIYNLTQQIDLRIARFLEVLKYEKTGQLLQSEFKMTNLVHLNKHYDLLDK